MAVFTVKKELLNEYAVNYFETCSKCKKLSLEREALHEIRTIFRGDIDKWISGNFAVGSILKVKNRKRFPSGSAKCNRTWKSSLFNSRNRCKVVIPDEFGRELGVLSPTAIQFLVCMYVCKSLFKHGKSSVKLKLKTKTNYNCFTWLPCGNLIYQLPSWYFA